MLDAHVAVTPAGSPVAVPMPVAPVVVIVIAGVSAVLTQSVGVLDGAEAVLPGVTVTATLKGLPAQVPIYGVTEYVTIVAEGFELTKVPLLNEV